VRRTPGPEPGPGSVEDRSWTAILTVSSRPREHRADFGSHWTSVRRIEARGRSRLVSGGRGGLSRKEVIACVVITRGGSPEAAADGLPLGSRKRVESHREFDPNRPVPTTRATGRFAFFEGQLELVSPPLIVGIGWLAASVFFRLRSLDAVDRGQLSSFHAGYVVRTLPPMTAYGLAHPMTLPLAYRRRWWFGGFTTGLPAGDRAGGRGRRFRSSGG
jgi:hypothetical protein